MTPYNGLLFFYILALLLIPAVFIGLFKSKYLKHYGLLFTIVMLFTAFDTPEKIATLAGFYLLETTLVLLFFKICKTRKSRALLRAFVGISLLLLILVKVGGVFPDLSLIHLLGVSYMTFRAVQVLIETYDGLITDINLPDFSYFLLFFPSVSSGPIDRYRRFIGDINRQLERSEYIVLLKQGIWKLMWGALFNFVLSSVIYSYWLEPIPVGGFLNTLSYMYGYTFFLFFNFAGYSLLAIGTAYILGVKLPENFNMPFLSRDMKDFWSRWHITLSTWLRDYVYTRFVMDSIKKDRFKNQRTSSYIGYIINMVTMGFWHGLNPQYIIYGAYHAVLMCANEILDTRWKRFKKLKRQTGFSVLLIVITFHLFSFGLLIFSGRIV